LKHSVYLVSVRSFNVLILVCYGVVLNLDTGTCCYGLRGTAPLLHERILCCSRLVVMVSLQPLRHEMN